MLSAGDTITAVHVHDTMVTKQSWISCILYRQCQFNKVHWMPTSTSCL